MDISKDKIKVKKKTVNAKKSTRNQTDIKKKTPKPSPKKSKQPPQEPKEDPISTTYLDKLLSTLCSPPSESTTFKELIITCREVLDNQLTEILKTSL